MAVTTGTANHADINSQKSIEHSSKVLTGKMSVMALVLSVLAFSAPMVVVSGYMPLAISVAGMGAPFAFILTTLVMLVFVVGYLAITKYIPKTGNFYMYIAAGLGKQIGLGSAFLAIASYVLILGNVYLFLGITFTEVIEYYFSVATPWWVWSLIAWTFVTILGYLNVEFSAKFMTTVMICEVLFILVFNSSVFFSSDRPTLALAPVLPTSLLDGNVILPLLFGIMVFIGLEATTVYRDEVENPDTTIPRATYISIVFIGLIYSITCYFVMSGYGQNAYQMAIDNPTGMFSGALNKFTGSTALQIKFALVGTSLIAALVSINNVVSRYIYGLGKDNVLPEIFGKVHDKHESPYIASFIVQIILVALTLPFLLTDKPIDVIFANMAGLGTAGIIALMALVSLSIIVWFRKNSDVKEHPIKTLIMPFISLLVMGSISLFVFKNMEMVAGGEKNDAWIFNVILGAIFVSGLLLAMYYKAAKPHRYKNIGC
ncbi:APC family permease [Acinetobacter tandoii]|nr:APC family permease [Acinetobacter tandoii]